jgi:hypothetical protein
MRRPGAGARSRIRLAGTAERANTTATDCGSCDHGDRIRGFAIARHDCLCSSLGPGGCADRTTIPDRGGRALVSPSPRSSRSISIGVLGTPRLRSISW